MQDLMAERDEKMARLDVLKEELRTSGMQQAKNERDYRVALAVATLQERHKGTPATITPDIVRGRPDIADLRMRRDNAEAVHKSVNEAIQVTKLQLRIIEAQIEREWSTPTINSTGENYVY